MDEPTDKPVVEIIQRSFFQTMIGKILLIIIIVIAVSAVIFFGAQFLSQNSTPNTLNTSAKITLTPNYGFKIDNLDLSCPVDNAFCSSQKLININNSPAIVYKSASGSAVANIIKLQNKENIAVAEDKKAGKKYIYESVVKDKDYCYTIAYTLPDDTIFGAILDQSILNLKSKLATLGSKTFQVGGEEANVLIQIKNTPMDPGIPCSLLKKSPSFFNNFD